MLVDILNDYGSKFYYLDPPRKWKWGVCSSCKKQDYLFDYDGDDDWWVCLLCYEHCAYVDYLSMPEC
jgi:hypothetical protein